MYPLRTITIDIDRPFDDVAGFLAEPVNFPMWATGLSSGVEPGTESSGARPGEWIAASPEGTTFVRFTPPNAYGIADHQVRLPDDTILDIPLRAIRNGDGTTIAFTLFRQPDMDDEKFESDAKWVQLDLNALKTLLEA